MYGNLLSYSARSGLKEDFGRGYGLTPSPEMAPVPVLVCTNFHERIMSNGNYISPQGPVLENIVGISHEKTSVPRDARTEKPMKIDQQLLSSIENVLNEGGCNYTVFLRSYVVPIHTSAGAEIYIRQAPGDAAAVGGIAEITDIEVSKEVESAISYAGDNGAGPSSTSLDVPIVYDSFD